MPQPRSMLNAISLRNTAMRSVPERVTRLNARTRAASAPFLIAAGLLIATDLANFAASFPATFPNTHSSASELDPRRFAPCMPTLEHSPAEYRTGSGDAVFMLVEIPHHVLCQASLHVTGS